MVHSVLLFDPKNIHRESPIWWRKFCDECSGAGAERLETINAALMDYAAHFHCTKNGGMQTWGNRYIDFYDERAYNWFILRWS